MQQVQDTLVGAWNWLVAYFEANPVVGMQLLIGLIAGWLASFILGGGGLLRDLIIGMIGSVIGAYIERLDLIHIGLTGLLNQIAFATIGALIVIVVGRVIFR